LNNDLCQRHCCRSIIGSTAVSIPASRTSAWTRDPRLIHCHIRNCLNPKSYIQFGSIQFKETINTVTKLFTQSSE
jgi:hypothetical protein